jgi:hypothetical protein
MECNSKLTRPSLVNLSATMINSTKSARSEREHKNANRDWTLFIDSDKFVLVKYDMHHCPCTNSVPSTTRCSNSKRGMPTNFPRYRFRLQSPRLRFGSVETPDNELELSWPRTLTSNATLLSPRQLLTHRWRTHTNESDANLNKLSKSTMSRIDIAKRDQCASAHSTILHQGSGTYHNCTGWNSVTNLESCWPVCTTHHLLLSLSVAQLTRNLHVLPRAKCAQILITIWAGGSNLAFATIHARAPSAVPRYVCIRVFHSCAR